MESNQTSPKRDYYDLLGAVSTVIGRSTALDRFAVGFDRTVLMDAIYQNVDALGSLKVAFSG